jgi:uracil-DNA glycosylase family 4
MRKKSVGWKIKPWKNESPPYVVETFRVSQVAEKLQPIFKTFKKTFIHCREDLVLNMRWNRFPGVYSKSVQKLRQLQEQAINWENQFQRKATKVTENSIVYPRGTLDAEVIICGIAPGKTKIAYNEAAWLLGPSSRLLDSALMRNLVYFTNISKESFLKNQYDKEVINEWLKAFLQELEIIQPRAVIFLGSYEVYSRIPDTRGIQYYQIEHPAYVARRKEKQFWFKNFQQLEIDEPLPEKMSCINDVNYQADCILHQKALTFRHVQN